MKQILPPFTNTEAALVIATGLFCMPNTGLVYVDIFTGAGVSAFMVMILLMIKYKGHL